MLKVTCLYTVLLSFERILVAYDGTEMSKRALSYAAYFSKKSDSKIVVINVVVGSTTRKVLTKAKTPLLIVHKQRTYKDEY
jgi:nucleotide-binding universal stress UspA family protein